MTDQTDGYVLPREDEEYQRLERQAKVWEEATRQTLARAGISSGQRCLDVGCGTGERHADHGRDDRAHGLGAWPRPSTSGSAGKAPTSSTTSNPAGTGSRRADLTTTETIDGAPFDVVFARLIIFHMADPVAALRKLWAAVAPGGVSAS